MTPEQIAEGRRLLDEADPAPWHLVMRPVTTIVDDDGMGIAQPFSHNAELIVWARNNLPALLDRLDRWAVVIDAGATILENNAKMLEHLVMDTPKDQELTDRIVDQTRRAAQSMRAALDGGQ